MSKSGTTWSLNNVIFGNTNTERFKFDVRGDWSQNYGGDGLSGPAVPNGKDIAVQAQKTYDIRFDESSKTFTVTPTGNLDTWYFRGTSNHWSTTAMNQAGSTDMFTIVATFANEDPSPRFRVDHFGDWKENYPDQDYEVADCTRYEISFNRANRQIVPKRLEDVSSAACPQQHLSLGATYRPEATTFALWSPDSANVQLSLDGKLYPMAPLPSGAGPADVYTVTVPGDQHLKRYNFQINGHTARDPYGVMVDPGTDNNVVVNLALADPVGGWAPRPPLKAREDAVIYEVHVRDFTIDPSSGVDPAKRGKFLGMVQPGTKYKGRSTGLDHMKELGITHVQILPFFDFRSCSGQPPSCYNWGYDPWNFNVPEERYSLHPDDPVERIRELKTMINEFHKAGIRVIMDVVYNHTADGSEGETTFTPITTKYFVGSDLSGTGNAVDDRKPIVSRFIRDSLEFWVREYHVDGFRFDLLGIFDYAEVGNWSRYLDEQFPDAMLLIYGEPWSATGDPQEANRVRLGTVGRIVDAHVGAFNDQYRKALKGDNDSGAGGGYIFNQNSNLFSIRVGSRGSIRYNHDPSQVLPNLWDPMFANDPEQTINYVSAHDNLILRDKILAWADDSHTTNPGYLKRIQEFADGIILTSQGIPFLEAGDEMLRDKQRNKNSYDAPDSVNAIRWQLKIDNADVFDYHRQVIALRRSHPGFRMTSWDQINSNCETNDALRYGVVVNRINAQANGDGWQDIIVIYNSADNYEYALPDGTWFVAMEGSDPTAGKDRAVTGKVTAEGTAVTVLHR